MEPQRISTPASLVDLLPTFMGIAEGPGWNSDTENLDGRNLLEFAAGNPQLDRPVYAEYLAETTTSPIFMIRRGNYKFIYSEDDPPLLFDIINDPDERTNLAGDAEHQAIVFQFKSEVLQKWDSVSLTEKIKISQQRRQLIKRSSEFGERPRWNHNENPTDKVLWYRGEGSYNDWAFAYLPVQEEN